jgi:hypothetical protein
MNQGDASGQMMMTEMEMPSHDVLLIVGQIYGNVTDKNANSKDAPSHA